MAKPNVPPLSAANVEKTSGLPFPKARKVTPAVDSFSPRKEAMEDKLGQKKSEAVMPMNENKKPRTPRRPAIRKGLALSDACSYHSA